MYKISGKTLASHAQSQNWFLSEALTSCDLNRMQRSYIAKTLVISSKANMRSCICAKSENNASQFYPSQHYDLINCSVNKSEKSCRFHGSSLTCEEILSSCSFIMQWHHTHHVFTNRALFYDRRSCAIKKKIKIRPNK